jgi:uncharacterized protein
MTDAANEIRSFSLPGSAGPLEALLNRGADHASYAALVCHPHPLYGGTFHTKVVYHAMKALHSFGWPVLRFNFRGVGGSAGEHDHGRGELDDIRTALNWLDREFQRPLILAGFSFGAATGLAVACPDPRVKAVIALGLPLTPIEDRRYDYSFLRSCAKPKLFVSGAADQFASSAELKELVDGLPPPQKLVLIEGADHFFAGRLRELRETIENWAKEMFTA